MADSAEQPSTGPDSEASDTFESSGFVARLFDSVDGSSVAMFRIAFGAVMLLDVWRWIDQSRLEAYFISPTMLFPFFDFVTPLTLPGLYRVLYALGACAIAIMIGFRSRLFVVLFGLGFLYLFLLDTIQYQNHNYVILLLCVVMPFVDLDNTAAWSSRRRVHGHGLIPAWQLWLLRFQIGLVYVYGALAKMNPDWLRGEPMRYWLAQRASFPVVGQYFTHEWAGWIFSYGGLFLDLLVVPAMLWKPTRWLAIAASLFFHVSNSLLFNIDIFPYLMVGAMVLFIDADTPRRVLGWVEPRGPLPEPRRPRLTVWLLSLWIVFHLTFPLRHYFWDGSAAWTQEGTRFSWRMKLNQRNVCAPLEIYAVFPDTGKREMLVDYTSNTDYRIYGPPMELVRLLHVAAFPDELVKYARREADRLTIPGQTRPRIHANVAFSLNTGPCHTLIDPDADLASVETKLFGHADWILLRN